MYLSKRIEKLENKSPNKSSMLHVIFLADAESEEDAAKRFCCENNLLPEQLKTVLYINPKDAATLTRDR